MSDWRQTTIGEVMTLQRGVDITRLEQREGNVPVVSSGGVASYHDTAFSEGPGVVMGRKGSLGKVFYFDGPYWPHDTTLWVRDFKGNDARFVYYFLTQLDTTFLDVGSANPTLNRNHVHPLPTKWPSMAIQQGIAEVLGALDDKIAANARTCDLLLRLADITFSGIVSQVQETQRLEDLVVVTKGASYRSADLDESSDRALVTLKSITRDGKYSSAGLKGYIGEAKMAQTVRPGEVVVAQTDLTQAAEVVGRAVRVPASDAHARLVASLDLAIVRPRFDMPTEFLLGLLRMPQFRQHCRDRTSGTTVLHLGRGAIESFAAPRVDEGAQHNYVALARPLYDSVDSLGREIAILSATRDALLPRLMSGKIKVKDAEHVVEGVA